MKRIKTMIMPSGMLLSRSPLVLIESLLDNDERVSIVTESVEEDKAEEEDFNTNTMGS